MQISKSKYIASLVVAGVSGMTVPYLALVHANRGPNRTAIQRQLDITPADAAASEAAIKEIGKHNGMVKLVDSKVFIDYDRWQLRDSTQPVQMTDSGRDKGIWPADALAYAKRNLSRVTVQPDRIDGVLATTEILENWTDKPLLSLTCVRMKNGQAGCRAIKPT